MLYISLQFFVVYFTYCLSVPQEVEEVSLVLKALADADIQNGRYPSPAVDVCVAFLLRETRFMEALEVSGC